MEDELSKNIHIYSSSNLVC